MVCFTVTWLDTWKVNKLKLQQINHLTRVIMNESRKAVTTCYIIPEDSLCPAVLLKDNTPVIVGRNINTKITDLKCPRQQVSLCAKYDERRVVIEQIGSKSCVLNGAKTVLNEKYLGKHEDRLEVLYGKHIYRIEFNPPESVDESPERVDLPKKRRIELDSDYDSTNEDSSTPGTSKKRRGSEDDTAKSPDVSKTADIAFTGGSWEDADNQSLMIFTANGLEGSRKIAGFDMDGTLITTKSGFVFPKDTGDWKLLYSSIPGRLKDLIMKGFKVVIFTNQSGLGTGKAKPNEFKQKIENIIKRLGVPIQVFIATSRDFYRKPLPGMWRRLETHCNGGVEINKSESFFVGDAAGRPKDWAPKMKKDHSSADRLLALNVELKFHTPEEFFLGQKSVRFNPPAFEPKEFLKRAANLSLYEPADTQVPSERTEVIVMVGCPGSGKSFVATRYLKDYTYINRDKLGTWQKCVAEMEKMISQGKSVVIDNTNPDVVSRKRFIDAAKKHQVDVRCFLMTTTPEQAKHNNRFRGLTDSSHMVVSDIVINSYQKFFIAPELAEGFTEIVKVNLIPQFESDDDKKLYAMYLLEK